MIAANRIGTGADGNQDPNDDGIVLAGDGTMVGGMTEGTGNFIVGNTSTGITVAGDAQRNPLLRNSVYNNEEVGINLGGIGFISASQDPLDVDGGANELQNAPNFQLTQGAMGNALYTQVYPALASAPNQTYRVEYFTNSARRCVIDYTDGQSIFRGPPATEFLGAASVTTDAEGYGGFDEPVKLPPTEPGKYLSGTATDSQGNTSNIGGCYEVIEIALPRLEAELIPVTKAGAALVEVRCIDLHFACDGDLRINAPGGTPGQPEGLLKGMTVPNDGRTHVRRVHLDRRTARQIHRRHRLRARLAISSAKTSDGQPKRVKLVAKRRKRS